MLAVAFARVRQVALGHQRPHNLIGHGARHPPARPAVFDHHRDRVFGLIPHSREEHAPGVVGVVLDLPSLAPRSGAIVRDKLIPRWRIGRARLSPDRDAGRVERPLATRAAVGHGERDFVRGAVRLVGRSAEPFESQVHGRTPDAQIGPLLGRVPTKARRELDTTAGDGGVRVGGVHGRPRNRTLPDAHEHGLAGRDVRAAEGRERAGVFVQQRSLAEDRLGPGPELFVGLAREPGDLRRCAEELPSLGFGPDAESRVPVRHTHRPEPTAHLEEEDVARDLDRLRAGEPIGKLAVVRRAVVRHLVDPAPVDVGLVGVKRAGAVDAFVHAQFARRDRRAQHHRLDDRPRRVRLVDRAVEVRHPHLIAEHRLGPRLQRVVRERRHRDHRQHVAAGDVDHHNRAVQRRGQRQVCRRRFGQLRHAAVPGLHDRQAERGIEQRLDPRLQRGVDRQIHVFARFGLDAVHGFGVQVQRAHAAQAAEDVLRPLLDPALPHRVARAIVPAVQRAVGLEPRPAQHVLVVQLRAHPADHVRRDPVDADRGLLILLEGAGKTRQVHVQFRDIERVFPLARVDDFHAGHERDGRGVLLLAVAVLGDEPRELEADGFGHALEQHVRRGLLADRPANVRRRHVHALLLALAQPLFQPPFAAPTLALRHGQGEILHLPAHLQPPLVQIGAADPREAAEPRPHRLHLRVERSLRLLNQHVAPVGAQLGPLGPVQPSGPNRGLRVGPLPCDHRVIHRDVEARPVHRQHAPLAVEDPPPRGLQPALADEPLLGLHAQVVALDHTQPGHLRQRHGQTDQAQRPQEQQASLEHARNEAAQFGQADRAPDTRRTISQRRAL